MPAIPPPLPTVNAPAPAPAPKSCGCIGRDIGLLLIRLVLATIFVYAGAGKLFGAFNMGGMEQFIRGLAKMNLPISNNLVPAAAWAAAITEFAGGIIIGIGLLTRVFALPLVFAMGVAVAFASGGDFMMMQFPMVMGVVTFALVFTGPGRISLDGAIFRGK